jgi:hypothetical protein
VAKNFLSTLHCIDYALAIQILSFTYAMMFFPLQSHPGGLLFTKFGSNQTALLDLAFPVALWLPPIIFFCIFV